jgi:hypothetical protein
VRAWGLAVGLQWPADMADGQRRRIFWVATADARGHLMRCQLLVRALRAEGVAVGVATTSAEGRSFLAGFGVDAEVISRHFRVEFDERQNMSRLRTEWRLARYFASPARFRRDLAWLAERAGDADLVVNDSFHPALLASPLVAAGGRLPPQVHVYGTHLRAALVDNFSGRAPRPIARAFAARAASLADAAFARLEHSLLAPAAGEETAPRTFVLPPVVAPPAQDPGPVRRALGVRPRELLAAVYLNPHFTDPAVAEAIEGALAAHGMRLYGVAEGYAGRPGWRPYDSSLADKIAAADLFLSAPGLAALAQARAAGTPLLALTTDQPEQLANLTIFRTLRHPCAEVPCAGADLPGRLALALERLAQRRAPPRPLDARLTWTTVLRRLLEDSAALAAAKETPWIAA